MEEKNSWIETISSPWRETLIVALKNIRRKLFIVSPYIKEEIVQLIQEVLLLREAPLPLEIHIVTRSLPEEFVSGSSDVEALRQIYKWSRDIKDCRVEIRIINNVHAKIWIFDSQLAIVGSGNATLSGLDTNVEYELAVTYPQTIKKIQQDWLPLWEYAELVTETQLTTMAEWVRKAQTASALLEKETKKQRLAIEKKIGKAPKLGKRYAVKTTKHVVAQPSLFDEPLEPAFSSETIYTISIVQLQQALFWIYPRIDDWTTDPGAIDMLFFKISWMPLPTQHLQLNWTDGKRLSQATIAGQSTDTLQNWSISVHFQQIVTLINTLQGIQTPQNNFQSVTEKINLLLSKEGMVHQLYISEPNRAFNMQKPILTGTQTNMPLPFSALKQPTSSIIIEHSQLIATLHQLEQQWYDLHEERKNRVYGYLESFDQQKYRPTILNLRLDIPGEHSYVHLLLESSDARLQVDLPGTQCVLVGPAIVITLDYKALWQALIGAQNTVNAWKICIDMNVDSLQLIPEFTKDKQVSAWRHELRHMEA